MVAHRLHPIDAFHQCADQMLCRMCLTFQKPHMRIHIHEDIAFQLLIQQMPEAPFFHFQTFDRSFIDHTGVVCHTAFALIKDRIPKAMPVQPVILPDLFHSCVQFGLKAIIQHFIDHHKTSLSVFLPLLSLLFIVAQFSDAFSAFSGEHYVKSCVLSVKSML